MPFCLNLPQRALEDSEKYALDKLRLIIETNLHPNDLELDNETLVNISQYLEIPYIENITVFNLILKIISKIQKICTDRIFLKRTGIITPYVILHLKQEIQKHQDIRDACTRVYHSYSFIVPVSFYLGANISIRRLTLRIIKYLPPALSFWEEKPESCPVCLNCISNELIFPLSCGHYVHRDCVVRSMKSCCPMCRKEVLLTHEELRKIHLFKEREKREHKRQRRIREIRRVISLHRTSTIDQVCNSLNSISESISLTHSNYSSAIHSLFNAIDNDKKEQVLADMFSAIEESCVAEQNFQDHF
jgi:hypothetical protein